MFELLNKPAGTAPIYGFMGGFAKCGDVHVLSDVLAHTSELPNGSPWIMKKLPGRSAAR